MYVIHCLLSDSQQEQTAADVQQLEELVKSHDALFLLMDTRGEPLVTHNAWCSTRQGET